METMPQSPLMRRDHERRIPKWTSLELGLWPEENVLLTDSKRGDGAEASDYDTSHCMMWRAEQASEARAARGRCSVCHRSSTDVLYLDNNSARPTTRHIRNAAQLGISIR